MVDTDSANQRDQISQKIKIFYFNLSQIVKR